MKNKILIILGDPESINSEIIFKSWKKLPKKLRKQLIIISNFELLKSQLKRLKYKISLIKVDIKNLNIITDKLKIINVDLKFKKIFKFNKQDLKKYILKSFSLAHSILLKEKSVKGLINCPIRKNMISNFGYGVTELLASKCHVKDGSEVMLIRNKKLSVSPVTTHINLKKVSQKLSRRLIITKVISLNKNFKKIFFKKPKIAILGLNPHNAELKKDSEENKIIIPAINILKKNRIRVYGPYVSDTIFINDYKKFDVIVGMYHDQVLAPFKALYKFNALNLTLGLKYLRVSPDHGVASNLIGKNKANPSSLLNCINFLKNFN
tara:strand:- start:1140 stop:2105 length:966 start_codon:yes stop_codon:yes gene_type:complete